MELLNSIFSWIIKKRIHQIELFKKYPLEVQNELVFKLIDESKNTKWGKKFKYKKIQSLKDFKKNIPISDYETLKPWIIQMKQGKKDILWPGEVKWFAKSSGTTSDKSKFIPVSKDSLEDCHYKAGKDMLSIYYNQRPDSKLFNGKSLVVGGSSQINQFSSDSYYGDLSAIIIKNLPFWVEYRRTPDKSIALMSEWEQKIEKMAQVTSQEDVTNIAGVPSWTLVLIKKILDITGKEYITDVWPNLELFMHGGVSFTPYKDQYEALSGKKTIDYLETYNASEGFFGIQDDLNLDSMLLMLDYGVYYEFAPLDELEKDHPETLGLDEVEVDKNYALIISTNGGLWRYLIGDTITFTSTDPFRIKVTGRIKHFINAFGEELIIDNAEKAIQIACEKTNSRVSDYTAAPVYMTNEDRGAHEWIIEFEKQPENPGFFSEMLDNALKSLNSDYEAKRYKDLALKPPVIQFVKKGTFYAWLKSKGKLGGQHKVPRLSNNRKHVDAIKKFIDQSKN
ncbi:MAG: GH3 auxin-responsive promoter family protein [Flavobacteriales bacterium]|nr:GH3 auxin-responsive promoter family protein [Flavobacteriales bacterium]